MPVTKSARGALKQQQRRLKENKRTKRLYKKSIKSFKKDPKEEGLTQAFSQIDRAAKKNVIHQNKAARLKSQLAKLIRKNKPKPVVKSSTKSPHKTSPKAATA